MMPLYKHKDKYSGITIQIAAPPPPDAPKFPPILYISRGLHAWHSGACRITQVATEGEIVRLRIILTAARGSIRARVTITNDPSFAPATLELMAQVATVESSDAQFYSEKLYNLTALWPRESGARPEGILA